MLKALRLRLTLICSAITGVILLLMALAALSISEVQLNRASYAAFQSNINSVVNRIQNDRSVSTTWLAQTEVNEMLIIHIEDAGKPLQFSGAWTPQTARQSLVSRAQETALRLYNVDISSRPLSFFDPPQAIFYQTGDRGESYLAGVTLLLDNNGWQSLTILKDMRDASQSILWQRILFFFIVLSGIALLFFASWWFAGRAIKPIEHNMKQQVEFVAAASHELRSPLAVIRASIGAISSDPSQTLHFTSNIERECSRMARLVEDLLVLAGGDAKTWSIRPMPIDTDTLLIDTLELFYPVAEKKGLQLLLNLPENILPPLYGDYQRLQQALSVLIDNALSYTPKGGKVTIEAESNNKLVTIRVRDTGKGIPKEQAEHIFKRFYKGDSSRGDKSHFGLGLSIAEELIKLHHGQLILEEADSPGAVFAIRIPIQSSEP